MASPLVRHYIRDNPEEAARALEKTDAATLRELIEDLEDDLAARLLNSLLPLDAARCLAALGTHKACKILERLPHLTATRLLALLDGEVQQRLLAELPEAQRQVLRHTLRYPDDSVGAAMLTDTPVCRSNVNVRAAKQMVRRATRLAAPILTVIDSAGRPAGTIAISELLRLREREPISEHVRPAPPRLRAMAPLETILKRRAWETEDYLPVVDAADKFVGLLTKTAVYQHVLTRDSTRRPQGELTSTVIAMAELMWRPGVELLVNASRRRED